MVAIHQWSNGPAGDEDKYFIAVPTNTDICGLTSLSLASAAGELSNRGIKYELAFQLGNCHVDDARNTLVTRFLDSDSTHLIFIDSDIVFTPEALIDLIDARSDFVGASYPYKDDSWDFPGHFEHTSFADEETGLVPIAGLPTGFLKLARGVFDTLRDKVQTFHSKTEPGQNVYEFFRRDIENGTRIGGDIYFTKLAAKHGIKPMLSPKIVLGHTGSKTWTGCWHWKQKVICHGYYPALREAWIEGRWENQQVMNDIAAHWSNDQYQGSSSYIQAAVGLFKRFGDKPCLEMGSGLSTLFLALQATSLKSKVVSLEEDRVWMGKTWRAVKHLGEDVLKHTDIRHVPTVENEYNVSDELYDTEWGLVCVDGPCGDDNKNGRAQALKFKADAYLFDDANRPQILATVKELEDRGYNSKFVGANRGRLILLVVRGDLCT